jgi:hypothetical protein
VLDVRCDSGLRNRGTKLQVGPISSIPIDIHRGLVTRETAFQLIYYEDPLKVRQGEWHKVVS